MSFSLLRRYRRFKSDAVDEFYIHVGNLLEDASVQKLDNYTQHNCYTRLSHSLDVAYFSFFIAKLLRWDCKSAARGGLLHDLIFYDWREQKFSGKYHAVNHPKFALENARKICELNPVEENIIRRHMWLLTLTPPRYKEAYIVTFVDKFCALREAFIGFRNQRRPDGVTHVRAQTAPART